MQSSIQPGQLVHDRSVPRPKIGIVVGSAKRPGQWRICRWRGGDLHWSSPIAVDKKKLAPVTDWVSIPITEAKRLAAAAFERNYLVHLMSKATRAADAAVLADIDRSNFRRLLQRHGLVKPTSTGTKKRKRKVKA